jgi:voltage-gated potassium channel
VVLGLASGYAEGGRSSPALLSNATLRRLLVAGLGLLGVWAIGTAGYLAMYDWSFTDASFMTVISFTSVGFEEVHPLDARGRWFTTGVILAGLAFLTYGITNLTAFLLEGELQNFLRKNRMEKLISHLRAHYVVCGAGRIGAQIVREFHHLGHEVVVVDQDEKVLSALAESCAGIHTLVGNATDDAVLRRAGITQAAGLATALAHDADNLFVVLSVRQMCPDARIIARVDDEMSLQKMLRAGADRAVCPAHIGGQRIASELLRPIVVDFLDRMTREAEGTLRMEEARVEPGTVLAGKTLAEAQIPARVGCVVVALRRSTGEFVFNPRADTVLREKDVLIVIGEIAKIGALRELTGERS